MQGPISRFDFYWVAHEVGQAAPDAWATRIPHAQIVDWRAWLLAKYARQTARRG